ncbi:MAG: Ig-like domain-containing protein [Colwellia sp.]|nr:Ig-like domain-containing protein [Colwellia sp.]
MAKYISHTLLNKTLILFSLIITLAACGGGGGGDGKIDVEQSNTTPIANAGEDINIVTTDEITLDGRLSIDGDNDFLTYKWVFASKPSDSIATLFNELTDTPSFVADKDGEYVVSLTVNDGMIDSEIDNAIVTAGPFVVNSVNISPAKLEVFKGRTLQLNADKTITGGSKVTITNEGSWTVSSSSIATISSGGLLTGIIPGTVNVTFTPNDSPLSATTRSIKIKAISELDDSFVTSGFSSEPIVNDIIQPGSQFRLTTVNNTGETMNLTRFEVSTPLGIIASTTEPQFLSDGSLTNGEEIGLTYTVGALGLTPPITLEYTLSDPVTGETFKVSNTFSE